jgi:hypothetical protein
MCVRSLRNYGHLSMLREDIHPEGLGIVHPKSSGGNLRATHCVWGVSQF